MSSGTHVNNYKPPSASPPLNLHEHTPPEEYDHNFIFPVATLRTELLELRPFVPSLHAQLYFDGIHPDPRLQDWLPMNLEKVSDAFLWYEQTFRSNPTALYHAIYSVPVKDGKADAAVPREQWVFAGAMGMINCSAADQSAEIGWIVILPPFQRTHVLTHAAGAMMHRILDSTEDGGLGLRRCQWFTNSLNEKSKAASLRLGFQYEGLMRAHRVLLPGKRGAREPRPGKLEDCFSRDTWVASVYWQDWEAATKEHIAKLMARR